MTHHTSGAADLPETLDAIADSQYLAGVTAGWNAAQANDSNTALRKIHESRAGYLKPLRDAKRAALAALAAGQAVPAEPTPDELRAIAREARNSSGSASDDCGSAMYVLYGWRAAISKVAPPAMDGGEVEDAARYQLVRRGQHWSVIDGIGNDLRGEALDAAVDTVRSKKGGAA